MIDVVGKLQYSEAEAAHELGVSVVTLRDLIRNQVTDLEEDIHNVPSTTFQASDLILLRLLMSQRQAPLLES